MTSTGPPPPDPSKDYVNIGTDDQMEVSGYKRNICKTIVVWFFILITVGFLRLVFYWKPHWMLVLTHDKCSLPRSDTILLQNHYKQDFVAKIFPLQPLDAIDTIQEKDIGRCFKCKKMTYIWDSDVKGFVQIAGLRSAQMTCSAFSQFSGLSARQKDARSKYFGSNRIEVHVTPICTLLFKEVLNPFYVFQVFSVSLWMSDEYYYYSTAIIIMSLMSIVVTIYQTRKMQRQLKRTITSSTMVNVKCANRGNETVNSELLVPGDVICIPRGGCVMQCDAALISGNCIVNESMLTGESVPVTKTPLPPSNTQFSFHFHAGHVLFSGTQVLQTRSSGEDVMAVVIRTGFATSKGELVRAIMYPKPIDFKFERDSYYFIGILASLAGVGFIYTIILMNSRGEMVGEIILRALDLFTIAVPPALPAAMTIGIMYALIRLKHAGIYCISPRSISVCGAINTVCFDKTGTLTEDGLDFHSVVLAPSGVFQLSTQTPEKISDRRALECMATCHSLAIIDNVVSGDPIDLVMYKTTQWRLEEPNSIDPRFGITTHTLLKPKVSPAQDISSLADVGVVRQFTFSSELQRMSVVTLRQGSRHFDLYTKGAPEMVTSLCKPNTVPHNFTDVLRTYTQKGYRVLALASRQLPESLGREQISHIAREKLENNLEFIGLLVMENRLKPETSGVIRELKSVDIRTVMLTGDNMLTAVSVTRESGMVDNDQTIIMVNLAADAMTGQPKIEYQYADQVTKMSKLEHDNINYSGCIEDAEKPRYHFAMLGSTWAVLRKQFPQLVPKMLMRCTVFARMSPEQKGQVVEYLQELGYYVCMCGDGANDCGALKAAHAGIALTEAEASVASPFTSSQQNIACVPVLIKNGRCALVTSIGIFKYMALYSIIQFTSVCLLYWISANLSDFGFLYIDLALITPFSIFYGRTGVYHKLVKEAPSASLISVAPVLSLFLHTVVQGAVQVMAYVFVRAQPWYTPYEGVGHDYVSFENATVFLLSNYQYIILVVVFSKGAPYRKSIFRNYLLILNIIIALAFTIYINVGDPDTVPDLEIKAIPHLEFKLLILGLAVAHFFVAMMLETNIIDSHLVRVKIPEALQKCRSTPQFTYESLEEELSATPDWPPVKSHDTQLMTGPSGDNCADDTISFEDGNTGDWRRNQNNFTSDKSDGLEMSTVNTRL